MANKIEKYYSILEEKTNDIFGKYRNIDDAISAADNHPTANQVVYVVEQEDLAFYSTTSFNEAEEELKAEKKKIATQKMLATKAAKKNQKEVTENEVADTDVVEYKKDESKDIEQNLLEEQQQDNQVPEPDSSDPKVDDVFISEKKDKAVIVKKVTNKCIVVDMLKIEFADHGSKNVSMLLDWYIFKKDIAGFQPYDKKAFCKALDRAKEMLAPIVF